MEKLVGDLAGKPIDRIPVAVVFLGCVDRSGDRPLRAEQPPRHRAQCRGLELGKATGLAEPASHVDGAAERNRAIPVEARDLSVRECLDVDSRSASA